jgi:hypothetical protein
MQGKTIILLAATIGLGLGALSVVYHHSLGRRAIGWWGPADMELIAYAPRVNALTISPTQGDVNAEGESVTIDSQKYRVERRQDVAQWPGIDHVRHGLLQDVNFNWDGKSRRSNDINWKYALEIIDGDRRLTVVFSQDGYLGRSDQTDTLTVAPKATGWREFFSEVEQSHDPQSSEPSGVSRRSSESSR